jgi:hypothetical protein
VHENRGDQERFERDGGALPPPRLLAGADDESTFEAHIVRGAD